MAKWAIKRATARGELPLELVAGLGLRAVGEIEALADTVRRVLSAATAVPPVTDAALACSIKAARNGEECEACQ